MLAFYPTRADCGYTLLEILFVLVLVGLAGSLVVPRLDGLYDSLVLKKQREELLLSLRYLPHEAQDQGQVIDLATPEGLSLVTGTLDDSWSISVSGSLQYMPNGFCSGGEVQLEHRSGRVWTYFLDSPYCVPREASDG